MRRAAGLAALLALATPVSAWEFSSVPVCTLDHDGEEASVKLTYDPRLPDPYEITLTVPAGWTRGPVFALAFSGGQDITISTGRHQIGMGGTTLSVSDRGFGNVLNGLEFNARATALIADQAVGISLAGAAPEVAKFRACAEGGIA